MIVPAGRGAVRHVGRPSVPETAATAKEGQNAAYARQRRKRDRDRDWSREISGRDTYLRFDLEPPRRFEDLRKRIEDGCRCNGHHIADGEDRHCIKCGHRRGAALPFARFIAARSAEARRARKPVA
jgi:hypothetical protein